MAIEKRTRPYELLVRWGPAGIAGAHVQFLEEIVEDGTVLNAKIGDALPVSMAGETGFPLQDVLSQQLIDTHSTIDTLRSDLAQAKQARFDEGEQLRAELAQVRAEGDLARSASAQLRKQLEQELEQTRAELLACKKQP